MHCEQSYERENTIRVRDVSNCGRRDVQEISMRSWQRALQIVDAQMRAQYYRRLIEVAKISATLARFHTEHATIEDMNVYLKEN